MQGIIKIDSQELRQQTEGNIQVFRIFCLRHHDQEEHYQNKLLSGKNSPIEIIIL